jgi:hypothetical protein
MVDIKNSILSERLKIFHDALDKIQGDIEVSSQGNITLSDEWTVNTGKFDQTEILINNITIKDLWEKSQTTNYENGVLSFNDKRGKVTLSDIVSDVDLLPPTLFCE